ncbi:MAG: replication factor C large subunit [Candidatus Nanoarchaeia archaeon]|jgi:replication factor C large subunit
MVTPWFDKHSPVKFSGLVGQDVKPLINHAQSKHNNKALLIHGPTGSGKTCAVHVLANELNRELIEVNASSTCDSSVMKSVVGNASVNQGLFGKRLILVDDIDALTASDRGAIAELISIIKKSKTPIILTATDPWNTKLRTLRGYCELVEFKKINLMQVKKVLASISAQENITISASAINVIASRSEGDLRAAINDLEMLAGDGRVSDYELDTMGFRDKTINVFQGLQKLFRGNNFNEVIHSMDEVDLSFDTKLLWVAENLTSEFKTHDELAKAYNSLSRADVFYGRINKRQYWSFLTYVNALMTVGVNNARTTMPAGFVKYANPSKIMKLWGSKSKRELRKQLAIKLRPAVKASINKTITEVLPFIKILSRNKELVNHYSISKEELALFK